MDTQHEISAYLRTEAERHANSAWATDSAVQCHTSTLRRWANFIDAQFGNNQTGNSQIGARMPSGEVVTNVYEAYEAGKRAAHQKADSVAIPAAEPVAWRHKKTKLLRKEGRKGADFEPADWEPLYATPVAGAQHTDAEGLTIVEDERDGNWYEFSVNGHFGLIRVVARMEDDEVDLELGKKVRAFLLAARSASSAQPVMTTDPWDELIRVLTEYEGALQEEDEEEIAPAREALIAFLKPYRAHIEAAQGEKK